MYLKSAVVGLNGNKIELTPKEKSCLRSLSKLIEKASK
jgi:hypothetical protein